ncbi:MAG: hypothetical protein HN341_05135 [Verrucomicrobia bacterium]|jgi:pimeloyl-ACP methyl ester carboxylesterase|nr:hypothetical protein [Verrucomicrobiota bacterium]
MNWSSRHLVVSVAAMTLFLCDYVSGDGTNDVVSPLVSYHFHETLSVPPAQPNVASPLASYLYYDWCGDSDLTFESSTLVSYLFHGPPVIVRQPVSKLAALGTDVSFDVQVSGSTPMNYQWYVDGVAVAGGVASSILVTGAQPDDAGPYWVSAENSYGAITTGTANLYLHSPASTPRPEAPTNAPALDAPPSTLTQPPRIPDGSQVQVFSHDGVLSRNRMTVVLTHGWRSSSDAWPAEMAAALVAKGYDVNILAWDWRDNAESAVAELARVAARTASEGEALGGELLYLLGAGYDKPIHFIGHSLGTKVNCRAANYLHGDTRNSPGPHLQFAPFRTHMTLLDEAEVSAVFGSPTLSWDLLFATAFINRAEHIDTAGSLIAAAGSWTEVIPKQAAWVDNYVSCVGFYHDDALNVGLWLPTANQVNRHEYAVDWYRATIANPLGSAVGHRWSFERNTLWAAPTVGRLYMQSDTISAPELEVTYTGPVGEGLAFPSAESYFGVGWLGGGLTVLGNAVLSSYDSTMRYAGNLLADFVDSYSGHLGTPVYSGTAQSTPAYFAPEPFYETEGDWGLTFQLQVGSGPAAPQSLASLSITPLSEDPPTNSAYIWIPVSIPVEAVALTFQFRFDSSGPGEYLTMGVSNVNCFTMEAEYVEDATWETASMIMVDEFAGQDMDLFFALNGASSEPIGSLSVRGIQFVIPPRPQLTLTVESNAPAVSWPLSAIGWDLYSVDSLSDTNWTLNTDTPTNRGFVHVVVDQGSVTNRFYRLQK